MPKFLLKLTCRTCPEQYDVFHKGSCIGRLRLRHGYFLAEYKGQIVYDTVDCEGDDSFTEQERSIYLTKACKSIWKAHKKEKKKVLYEIE